MGTLMNRIPQLVAKKDFRDNKRYSQRDIARETGLSDNAISRVMRYKTLDNVPFRNILIIANWLGITDLRELVEESDTDVANTDD